jgi:hypothetical protein
MLGDPSKWDDKNDSALVEAYRKHKNIKKVFALCFAECAETYHHWKIYGEGASGVCIEFEKTELLETLTGESGLRMRKVQYCRNDRLSDHADNVDIWPFLKRLPFKGEEEFRLVLDYNGDADLRAYPISFSLASIKRIYLSPWLSRDVIRSIEVVIRQIPECEELIITRTGLVDHSNWRSVFSAL